MPKCYAFDRDGTVETSQGPIPISAIKKLKDEGHVVYAIGNPILSTEVDIPNMTEYHKGDRLVQLKKDFSDCSEYIVVDNDVVVVDGWKWYSPEHFMAYLDIKGLKKVLDESRKISKESVEKVNEAIEGPTILNEEFKGETRYSLNGKTRHVPLPDWTNLETTKRLLANQKSNLKGQGATDISQKILHRIIREIKL